MTADRKRVREALQVAINVLGPRAARQREEHPLHADVEILTALREDLGQEPQYEYGVAIFGDMGDIQQWATEAKARDALQVASDRLVRRVAASPWEDMALIAPKISAEYLAQERLGAEHILPLSIPVSQIGPLTTADLDPSKLQAAHHGEEQPVTILGFNEAIAQQRIDAARAEALTEEERVALDKHGATVVQISDGLYEVWCASHAIQLVSPDRAYLRRRAEGHNRNHHPDLEKETP